ATTLYLGIVEETTPMTRSDQGRTRWAKAPMRNALLSLMVFLFAFACADGDHVLGYGPSTGTPDGGDDGAPWSGDDGGLRADAIDGGPAPPETRGCSGDLHDVLGADGKVVEHCAPALGCYGGVCIPPCEAAAKSQGTIGCDFVVSTPYMSDPTFNGQAFF